MSGRRDALERALCGAVFALCCAMTAYYLIAGYGAYLDADMASELALAQHLSEKGVLISDTWYYSTEIRLLATQLGAHAAELLAADRGGLAVGIRGTKLIEVPFSDVQKGDHAADAGLNDLVNVMAVIN